MTTEEKDQKDLSFDLDFHAGGAITDLAQHYQDPESAVREAFQNALDKGAKHILMIIHEKDGRIEIFDSGVGAGRDEIMEKLQNIGRSFKSEDNKGIGNLGGLSIAQTWQLITREADQTGQPFLVYELSRAQSSQKKIRVQVNEWPSKSISNRFPWRVSSMVRMTGVSPEHIRRLANIARVADVVRDAYSHKIRKLEADLRIRFIDKTGKSIDQRIEPFSFSGKPLGRKKVDTEFGPVQCDFYFSARPKEHPRVLIQIRGTDAIPVWNLIARKQLSPDIGDILRKGHFEGIMTLSFGQINAAKDAFLEGGEDSAKVSAFARAVEGYVRTELASMIQQMEEEGRVRKYQQISKRILFRLSRFFREHPDLYSDRFRWLVGGNTDPEEINVGVGVKTGRKQGKKKKGRSENPPPKNPPPAGDATRSRRGLNIVFVNPSEEEGFNWHSRTTPRGVIEINLANDRLLEVERRGMTKLEQHLLMLVLKEVTLSQLTEAEKQIFNSVFERRFIDLLQVTIA